MKYIDADKIRTEIKRLKAENNCGTDEFIAAKDIAYDKVFDFLDTLEEPVSDCHDLEEAARAYSEEVTDGHNYRDLTCGFIAGAEWQKAKMLNDNPVIMSVEDFQALIDSHAKRVEADYKEKMMEGAVECVVCAGMEGDKWIMTYIGSYESMLKTCKAGDKVKIIIVKEEE